MLPFERLVQLNTKENLWIYVLSLLRKKELYGYQIPKIIEKRFGFKPGKITPYRVLYRLESKNLVQSEIRNRKRIYRITKKGREELEKAKRFYKEILGILTQ